MATLVVKFGFVVGIGATSLGAGLLPIYNKAFRESTKWASIANCFAGGVFIAVSLIHLLVEGLANIEATYSGRVPIGVFLMLAGYTLILFIEKIAFGDQHDQIEPSNSEQQEMMVRSFVSTTSKLANRLSFAEPKEDYNLMEASETKREETHSLTTAFLLAIALTIHSLLAGIGIGIQTGMNQVISLGIAILLHKMPAAMALGVSMRNMRRKLSLILMSTFVSGTPIGILIGIGLDQLDIPLLKGIFLCLCAGTFLYISCSEVIVQEFSLPGYKFLKMGAFLFGMILFAFLNQIITE